ncbi:MAG: gamma-glutamylcyclotransferase [Flavobacteriales bacterium]|nr:gamma-glutamylcyclotransferase [Flavobacteriales bacterium]
MSTLVFGYGSLLNAGSIERTLGRTPAHGEFTPARLRDHERVWDYSAQVHADAIEGEVQAVFLNLRACHGASVNGALFVVDDRELRLLATRERFYSMVEVNGLLNPAPHMRAVAFICTNPLHLAAVGQEACIMQGYIELVREGCASFGQEFIDEFGRTTRPAGFPVVQGPYRFMR